MTIPNVPAERCSACKVALKQRQPRWKISLPNEPVGETQVIIRRSDVGAVSQGRPVGA